MKNKEEKLSFLQRRGWFKSKELQDRTIDFTKEEKEDIIMTAQEEPTAFTEEPDLEIGKEEIKEAQDYLVEMKPKEHHETSTNDDLRNKRKVVSFVSGEDYDALEKELETEKKRRADVEQKLQEIRKILI